MRAAPAWELFLYLLIIAYVQLHMIGFGWRFCSQVAQRAPLPGTQRGWLPGYKLDLSDVQWREFRASLPLLAAGNTAFLLLSHAVRSVVPGVRSRVQFYVAFSALFVGVLHGWCLAHVAALAALHFLLANALAGTQLWVRRGKLAQLQVSSPRHHTQGNASKHVPLQTTPMEPLRLSVNHPFPLCRARHGVHLYRLPIIWATACAGLLLVRISNGLPFAGISPALAALDQHRGLLRWHIHYNLLVLRMLSFACDLHWARLAQRTEGRQVAGSETISCNSTAKVRTQQHLPLSTYSWLQYWAYILYPPLYIAGPIITFNSFAWQLLVPARLSFKQVLVYAARWALALLALELLTHTLHFNSIAKYRAWRYIEAAGLKLTSEHYAEGSYWVLMFMWLKFTVIWRFFRLVALADGLEVLENMTRCVSNNYDIEGFWRSWHASYNQWLVRYMYIPLGGSAWRLLNVWPIFTFVALWHDLEWRLLGWAWMMALAMAPEMACKALAKTAWARSVASSVLWRHACAAAAAINILVLMTANMVGFVVGLDGAAPLLQKILAEPAFVAATLGTLFCAAQLMFALRAREL